jgi:hypothetical protein
MHTDRRKVIGMIKGYLQRVMGNVRELNFREGKCFLVDSNFIIHFSAAFWNHEEV